MRADVRISMQGNECECIYASGVYIKVNRQGVWQKSKVDDDYVLAIPIVDEVKKNDNTTSNNKSDTE
jgi:hypothetical protein